MFVQVCSHFQKSALESFFHQDCYSGGTRVGAEVPEVSWCEPGEDAALEALIGKAKGFINMYYTSLLVLVFCVASILYPQVYMYEQKKRKEQIINLS